jgi:hypothetical protein
MDSEPQRRFDKLPEPVDPATLITTKTSADAPDPDGRRDTDRDFMLRNAGA